MIWMILGVILLVPVLWCLMIKTRNGHKKMNLLKKYRYAHRGLHDISRKIPENSLAAFRLAAEKGYGAELDIHLTADGKLAVIHDSNLKRSCGKDVTIEAFRSDEIDRFRLFGTDEKIPHLHEVLDIFEDKAPLIIELKTYENNPAALTEAVCRELDGYKGEYCIESFDFRVLMWLRKHRPDIVRGQLASFTNKENELIPKVLDFIARNMLTNFLTRPDFVAYNYRDRQAVTITLCRKLWKAQEVSWTIKTKNQLEEVEKDGAIPIFEGFEP